VSPDPGQDRTGGDYLLEFVGVELAREENRRSSLETRGQSVAALAAGIVALIAALRQFAGLPTFDMGKGAATRALLVACILLFVGASFTAALTNAPRRLSLVDPVGLLELAPELWGAPGDVAHKMIFTSQLNYLDQVQRANDQRGRLLFCGMVFLTLGVLMLAVAVSIASVLARVKESPWTEKSAGSKGTDTGSTCGPGAASWNSGSGPA
jgi:hypothetical protein